MSDNKLLFDNNYDDIDKEKVFIDTENDTIINNDDLYITPFDVIKQTAEALGQTISEPKKNCKHCNGRGYIGRDADTKAPIACKCIYTDYDDVHNQMIYNNFKKLSRKERRKLERENKKRKKRGK